LKFRSRPAKSSAILAAGSRRVELVSIGFWPYLFWSAPQYGLLPLGRIVGKSQTKHARFVMASTSGNAVYQPSDYRR